ncbi:MAG TPA: XRE family transcriptional regulator [Candidatus Acidoferrum sp.]|nr:XRE family transcriptional regulator [Candidatus Acidoferrum sp.]
MRNLSALFSLAVQCLLLLPILKASGLTQVELAKILGVQQPQASPLMRNRAANSSVRRVLKLLTTLRLNFQITVRPSRKPRGSPSVLSS